MSTVLIIDDEKSVRLAFAEAISDCGLTTLTAQSCSEALEMISKGPVDAALIDLMMPDIGGIETLREIKKLDPDLPIFMVSGYADVAAAVEAVRLGAYDYILKPPDFDRLCLTLKRAAEQYNLLKENRRLNTALDVSLENIFGSSASAKKIISELQLVAKSSISVVIQGETGTGKTTAAHSIHRLSKRAEAPFVVVDMGAIPETLVESELFGHEKGAFTGADKKKKGFFEMANGGTIVIDELQNMSPYVQGKLLRVVEEKRLYPLGSTSPVDIDVRIIAATNTDLGQAVKERKFREDLFFRICEYSINMPPLRERIEDIVPLAERFLAEACAALNMSQGRFSEKAASILRSHTWRGNARELKNVVKRAVLSSSGDIIKPKNLGFLIADDEGCDKNQPVLPLKELAAIAVRDVEAKAVKRALELTGGNKTRAAAMLQIDYKTLLTKIRQYNIRQS